MTSVKLVINRFSDFKPPYIKVVTLYMHVIYYKDKTKIGSFLCFEQDSVKNSFGFSKH